MPLDYAAVDSLRRNHAAWRLLLADLAPLVVSFLHRAFVAPNVRSLSRPAALSALDDHLFQLRETLGESSLPRTASEYLDDWSQDGRGWLRRFYPTGSDELHYDLMPATEKAILWLQSLSQRAFVGTESRLMTVFELLRQVIQGSEADPQVRIAELQKQRAELDRQIARIERGDLGLLDNTAVKDRFLQVAATARELLSDFREVEHNFRALDRDTRERIARWEGAKGALLEQIFGQRDEIADSDQGKSFRAFWDFLMSPLRQEELSALLEGVFALPAVQELSPDKRLKRIHYDWLEAGEHTQRTVAKLSEQLRRYLDEKAYLENSRILQILRSVEGHALDIRLAPPRGTFMEMASAMPNLELPMEKTLFNPPLKAILNSHAVVQSDNDAQTDALYGQIVVDKQRLAQRIRQALQTRSQVSLTELLLNQPLEQGLAELVAWLSIASDNKKAIFDESQSDKLSWTDAQGVMREATLPRVIFCR